MNKQFTPSSGTSQLARQHWRCPACGEKGSVAGEEDLLRLIHRTLQAHHAQNPSCTHAEAVELYVPDRASAVRDQDYDPSEPMHTVGVSRVAFSAWSPGDVQNGDPLTQIHIFLTVPALQAHLLVRLKTAEACDDWIENLMRLSGEVFPKGGA